MTESTARAEAEKHSLYVKLGLPDCPECCGCTIVLKERIVELSEENARLRKVLEIDHAMNCACLTRDVPCDCGWNPEVAEAKLREKEQYPNLDAAFLATMNEIGQYGFDKYREESFQHKRLTGDRTRHMERIYPDVLSLHAIEHFEMYLRGESHDHFKTLKHQLAAVAFNAMMEFYFAGLDELPSPPTEGKDK